MREEISVLRYLSRQQVIWRVHGGRRVLVVNPQGEEDPQEPEHDRGGERMVEGSYGVVFAQDGRQRRDPNRRGDLSVGVEERGSAAGFLRSN